MYFTLKLKFDESLYDQLIDVLFEEGITAFEEGETIVNNNGDIELVHERTMCTLRFEKEDDLRALLSRLKAELPSIECEESTHTDDYLNAWKSFSKEIEISKNILITPSWFDPKNTEHRIKIILDPGYAFGSGSHETTILCSRELEECRETGSSQTLLDVGCGSGILSIIGSKLGYQSIVGVDIDPHAIDASYENAERNNVSNLNFSTNTLDTIQTQFDVVVANILSSTLKELKKNIVAKLEPQGTLILSGILKEEVIEVAKYYNEFNFVIKIMNEWACMRGKRK